MYIERERQRDVLETHLYELSEREHIGNEVYERKLFGRRRAPSNDNVEIA